MACTKDVIVRLSSGLHHQAATRFIQTANNFSCTLRVIYDGNSVNAKSLLGVLSLGIVKGTAVNIVADGVDENEAISTLSALIDSDFSE